MTCSVRVGGRELSVVVCETLADFRALRDLWKELASDSASESAFLTWEWLYAWSECFIRGKRRLFLVIVSEGPKLIGIAPWYIDDIVHRAVPVREISFLGLPEGGSDYLDVVARKGMERVVAEALFLVLFDQCSSRWDVLGLKEIPGESPFLLQLISQLRQNGKHYKIDEGSYCPGVQLSGSYEQYLGKFSSHRRHAFKREMKALFADGEVHHQVYEGGEEVAPLLPVFRDLYEKRWERSADDLFNLLLNYLPRSSDAWQVQLSLLTAGDRTVAGLLHLMGDQKMYQYLMAVDRTFNPKISVGSLISAINIEGAIKAGLVEYDFLKGQEDHKLKLMNRARRSINISVHNKTLRSLSAWSTEAATHLGKLVLR